MISEYILKIWIGNVIIFFFHKIYYILSIFPICRVCPESVPSLSRVDELHASRVFAESESCNIGHNLIKDNQRMF